MSGQLSHSPPLPKSNPRMAKGSSRSTSRVCFQHPAGSFVPNRPAFRPGAGDVGVGQTPDEISRQTPATMSHTVSFHKSHPLLIPDLPLLTQERARLGPSQPPASFGLVLGQQPIDRRGADLIQELLLRRQQLAVMFFIVRQP